MTSPKGPKPITKAEWFAVCALVLSAAGLGISCQAGQQRTTTVETDATPWTHLDYLDRVETFQFAVVGDRAGGHRPGVFKSALDRLAALGPTFVMSVGDLLDTRDIAQNPGKQEVEQRWDEFGAMVNDLPMPFFYVPGNNDLRNVQMEGLWRRRFGSPYYHFLYQDVLFIVLDTEDPPGPGGIGDAQLAWLRGILAENAEARWTFLFMHRRLWGGHPAWTVIEEALGSRPRTSFGGHTHLYAREEVNGHAYYGLATTGGGSTLSGVADGSFDHVVWVNMTEQGPRVVNLMLDGIWGDDPANEVGR